MLPWWGWALLWLGLLAGSVVLLWLRVRSVWRRAATVVAELDRAGRALSGLEEAATSLQPDPDQVREPPPGPPHGPRRAPGGADLRHVH